jgi:hypothetical protein
MLLKQNIVLELANPDLSRVAWSLKLFFRKRASLHGSGSGSSGTIFCLKALVAWRSGHRIRLKNEKTRVQIPPWYKYFSET